MNNCVNHRKISYMVIKISKIFKIKTLPKASERNKSVADMSHIYCLLYENNRFY